MATNELGYQLSPDHQVAQSGLCVSGQTIRDAATRILNTISVHEYAIINVGSVDLLHGRAYVDMISDLMYLLRCCNLKGIKPMLSTLAPLANCMHNEAIKKKLLKFNSFIRSNSIETPVIDIWKCMVNLEEKVVFPCYQQSTRFVSGSNKPHVLWSKLGRVIVLACIKDQFMEL